VAVVPCRSLADPAHDRAARTSALWPERPAAPVAPRASEMGACASLVSSFYLLGV